MRALMLHKIGRPEDLTLEDIPALKPGEGEVLVEMRVAAVNFPDLLTIEGKYQVRPELPFVPGKEGAGVVAAVGTGVTRVKPGDRVMIQVEYGTFAEQAIAPEHECYLVPENISFDEAASIGIAFQTSYLALIDRAKIQAGETVLVTAASGSVGIAAIQLAKQHGCKVIAGLTTLSKEEAAKESGADHVIDLSTEDPRNSIRDQIFALTNEKGVDVVIEMVGGEVFHGSIRSLKFRGRLVVVGFTSGVIAEMKTNYVLLKNIAVIGVDRGQYRDKEVEWMQDAQKEIFQMCADGKVGMPVQASFTMEDIVGAFDLIRDRKIQGKVVLEIQR